MREEAPTYQHYSRSIFSYLETRTKLALGIENPRKVCLPVLYCVQYGVAARHTVRR
jgi:hypothetical protein